MMNVDLLDREIERELEKLKTLEQGSKEHSEAVEAVCKLYKAKLDQEKSDLDREKHEEDVKLNDRREANREIEYEKDLAMKDAEHKDRKKQMIVDIGKEVLKIGSTVGLTLLGWKFYHDRFNDSLLFEKSDSISTIVGKNTINRMEKLLPKN